MLTTPTRRKRILGLALPIVGGMVSQNVLNLVDTAMVGSLGDEALAAVGIGSFANFLSIAFIMGLSTGVQAIAARRLGEGRESETAGPLNVGLVLAVALSVPASILIISYTPVLFPYLHKDPALIAIGIPYLQARLIGMTAVGMNFAFRGYWNAINMSRLYMRTIIVMHITNIVFNYLLIFGKFGFPLMGATGAGVASAIATYVGTLYYFYMGFRHARPNGFLKLFSLSDVTTILRLALPSSFQQFFFAAGMTMLFWIIGRVDIYTATVSSIQMATAGTFGNTALGTQAVAASNVLINLLLVGILPGIAFGIAAASLVGQALGKKDPEDAKAWGWDVARLASLLVGSFTIPAVFFPDLLLGIFIHNPETIALARGPLRLLALTLCFDTVGMVLLNALQGAGDTRRVMYVSIVMQWFLFLPIAYIAGPMVGLLGIWALQIGYRSLQSVLFSYFWQQGKWQTIQV